MRNILTLVQYGCALTAAIILGNWYLTEFRKLKAAGKPWYAAYLSAPGLIIIGFLMLIPLIAYLK